MTAAKLELERFEKAAIKKGREQGLEQGLEQGREQGLEQGLRQTIADLCELLGISIGVRRRRQLEKMDKTELKNIRAHIKAHHAWPT